jgi:putative photosynthetic complex assembly protein 2
MPVLYASFLWWFATGLVMWLNRGSSRLRRTGLVSGAVLTLAALAVTLGTRDQNDVADAYLAFTAALLVWGWLEMTYFFGWITGPRTGPCPPRAAGTRRFIAAVEVSLHHELTVVATGLALVALTWNAANPVAGWTFLVLWLMRWSAKINLFLGVPRLHTELLPDRLQYLATYMRRRPMNELLPFSITVGTAATASLVTLALSSPATPFEATGAMLVAALLGLAVLEHWFMVLTLPDNRLWRWALGDAPLSEAAQTSER